MNNNTGLSKGKKITIISLLSLIIVLLAIFLFMPTNKKTSNIKITRTVMIYIDGSNLESESGIASADIDSIDPSKIDLKNNNILLYTGGTKKWHNYISNNGNAIYQLTKDGFKEIETYGRIDMGDYETLSSFLKYSYENFKTDKYDLIFYNHGGALDGAIYDDFTNEHLELADISKALSSSSFNSDNKLEIVLFRTCLNGTIEVANIFKDYADYMVSSEEITYGSAETPVLSFLSNLNEKQSAIDLSKNFIKKYFEQIDENLFADYDVLSTYSILDLSKVDKVNKLINEYFSKVNLDDTYQNISKVRSNLYQYAFDSIGDGDSSYDTVDLYSLVKSTKNYSSVSNKDLLSALDELIIYNKSTDDESKGISIYFPYNGVVSARNYFLDIYKEFDYLKEYNEFIKAFSSYKQSHRTDSYSSFNKNSPRTTDRKREFEIKLTDEQIKNFSKARYMIFEKNSDNTFNSIYASDNVTLTDNTLKTNLTNNLIKIIDKEDNQEYFIPVVSTNGDKTKSTPITVYDWNVNKDMSEWYTGNANMIFNIENEDIKDRVIVESSKNKSKAYSGGIIDENNLTSLQFVHSSFVITDANGNYNENWDNKGIVTAIEVKPGKYELKMASLDDNKEDYYIVFKIEDIYGNISYSNLLRID